jgi:PAS domain S-box-containing protein
VSSGEEAINAIESKSEIDLILMDINLGRGISGTKTAELILERRNLPIIFLSSHTEREIVEKTEGITSYGYIVKNSGDTVLIASVKMAFRLYEARIKEQEKDDALRIKNYAVINSINGIIFSDLSGNLTYANDAFLRMWSFENENEIIGKHAMSFMQNDYEVIKSFKMLRMNGSWFGELRAKRRDGSVFYVQVSSNVIRNKSGSAVGYMAACIDITGRIVAEEKARKTNKLLADFIKCSPIYAFVKEVNEKDSRVLTASENFKDMIGISGSDMNGKTMRELFPPDFAEKMTSDDQAVVKDGKVINLEESLNSRNYITVKFPLDIDGEKYLAGYTIDVTEQKKTEKILCDEYNKTRNIINSIPSGLIIYQYDETGRLYLESGNPEAEKLIGRSMNDLIWKEFDEIWPEAEDIGVKDRYLEVLKTGTNIEYEEIFHKDDNIKLALRIKVFAITGKKLGVAFEDITESKKSQTEIQRQLSEKEILMREAHHRIKNNLISVENLLKMQASSVVDTEAHTQIQDAISRIASVRVLYEKLLISDNLQDIPAGKYIDDLIDAISDIYPEYKEIKIIKKIDNVPLKSRQVFPLGIIINELMTNAVKYAFQDRDDGTVDISLIERGGHLVLIFKDNGIGMPCVMGFNLKKGFGMMLIKILSEQLGGACHIDNESGTKITVEFDL